MLLRQIEALKGNKPMPSGTARTDATKTVRWGDLDEVSDLQRQLDEAKEKEILLLEAYEQLERDVGREIDKALSKQSEEGQRLQRRVQFLETALADSKRAAAGLQDSQARLEGQLSDVADRNRRYEAGVYGLPQAVAEIKQLKEALLQEDAKLKDVVQQNNRLAAKVRLALCVLLRRQPNCQQPAAPLAWVCTLHSEEAPLPRQPAGPLNEPCTLCCYVLPAARCFAVLRMNTQVEDMGDENAALRAKAGLPRDAAVDISDLRAQRDSSASQMRALNALLERQVADLEEERRKLRMELKFRAKHHGQHALEVCVWDVRV